MGKTEARSALFEQAVANLLAIAPGSVLRTRADDPFDFLVRGETGNRVAVEVKSYAPPVAELQRLASKPRLSQRADELWLVTPKPPTANALEAFRQRFASSPVRARWLDATSFQLELGLAPRPLESEDDYARLQFAAAATRLAREGPESAHHVRQLTDDVGWAAFGRLQLNERIASPGPQAFGQSDSVADFLRLGEQREDVTVLTSDLANYSALVRARPRQVVDVMNRYYRRARQVVLDRGGFFYQFTGDGVVAMFGYPRHDGQAPVRATLAAADLVRLGDETLEDLTSRINEAFAVGTRIGIATDELTALNASDQSFDPVFIGNAINLAARLQVTSTMNGLLMDNQTHRALTQDGGHAPLGGTAVVVPQDQARGQQGDINAWRVERPELIQFAHDTDSDPSSGSNH